MKLSGMRSRVTVRVVRDSDSVIERVVQEPNPRGMRERTAYQPLTLGDTPGSQIRTRGKATRYVSIPIPLPTILIQPAHWSSESKD
jgi:hypothetical protein